jgi:hypothetical protein
MVANAQPFQFGAFLNPRAQALASVVLSAALLLWPALWNGYPLVFSDSGTYLSQAVRHYVGWDRPIFYSLFLVPLHLTLTTWPVIVAQALLTAHTLHLVRRTLLPGAPAWSLVPLASILTITTSLPWFVTQLIPDVFTGLLTLTLALLIFVPERLSPRERPWLVALTALMIATHLSHIPLTLALLLVLLPLRDRLGAAVPLGVAGIARSAAPLTLAVLALMSVNLFAFGHASLSPFGNIFLLARVIYDGPGQDVLRRDCPASGWRLCAFADRLPSTTDDFLWLPNGPLAQSGGAKMVSAEANAIISAALRAEPVTELRAVLSNVLLQLAWFATGDGLQPWPATVTPWIERIFPTFEAANYARSRQTNGTLAVPPWLNRLHNIVAIASIAGLLLPLRKRSAMRGFAAATVLALLVNAAVTGGLSMPHDRYQSRIIWLPPLVLLLSLPRIRPA